MRHASSSRETIGGERGKKEEFLQKYVTCRLAWKITSSFGGDSEEKKKKGTRGKKEKSYRISKEMGKFLFLRGKTSRTV